MLYRCVFGVLAWGLGLALGLGLLVPADGQSGELLRILRGQCRRHPEQHQGGLQAFSVGSPAHWYPQYNYDAPRGPVPAYSWGYFGAHYRPTTSTHIGYYHDYYQWGYRGGY